MQHEASLRVLDHGPGLSDADLARVFEPFRRGPDAQRRAGGLAGGKRVAETLDGRVRGNHEPWRIRCCACVAVEPIRTAASAP